MDHPPEIRDARDDDAGGLIALIGGVFAEYPGCFLDVDGEMPELLAIATHFRRAGGRIWVADDGGVVGSIGLTPSADGRGVELRKLYLRQDVRGSGLGDRLLALVEDEALGRGAAFVEMWSDTRFLRAHRFYERRGYVRGATRELHDISNTVEFHFHKPLPPRAD
jgi:putative acetyltransferase